MAHGRILKLALALFAAGALIAPGVGSSAQSAEADAETFTGECQMSGTIRHQQPLTNEPAPNEFHGRFRGGCSGSITNPDGSTQQLDQAPAIYDARGGGDLSCLGGIVTGMGSLIFDQGTEIDFRFTERRAPGAAVVTLEGVAGGSATVLGTLSRMEELPELGEQCSGSGVRVLRGDARIASPGISG